MTRRFRIWALGLASVVLVVSGVAVGADEKPDGPAASPKKEPKAAAKKPVKFPKMVRSDRIWRSRLNYQQYLVTRRKATEPAFSGRYWNHHEDGVYACVGCATPLFDSETKFDSGTGWPSYWQTISRSFLKTHPDFSDGTMRTEVNCRVCDAHMGHVFNDGPRPTGLRFCINSAAIEFVPRESIEDHVKQWRKDMGLPPLETEEKKPEEQAGETMPDAAATEDAKPAEVTAGGSKTQAKADDSPTDEPRS